MATVLLPDPLWESSHRFWPFRPCDGRVDLCVDLLALAAERLDDGLNLDGGFSKLQERIGKY
jgi:hypothetical protein